MVHLRRMAKAERRRHLLDAAAEIIGSQGSDALTLAHVAERSGVTKPVAYQHFGTRSGLLMALYRDLGNSHAAAVADALKRQATGPTALADIARLLSTAFIDCVLENGAQYSAISAALAASAEMDGFRQEIRDETAATYQQALALASNPPQRIPQHLLIGILGAAEALAESAARGSIRREDAIASLCKVMDGVLRDQSQNTQ